MSDIGLAGVSTTALSRIGPNGETLAGGVNDTTSSLSPFGPGNAKGLNEANEVVKNVDTEALGNLFADARNILSGIFDGFLSDRADLKYPLETEGGAYQARVQFRMYKVQLAQDGNSQKAFSKISTDNIKGSGSVAKSVDKKNEFLVDDFSELNYGNPGVGNDLSGTPAAGFGNPGTGNEINAAASGPQATTADTSLSGLTRSGGSTFKKKIQDIQNSDEVKFLGNKLSGKLVPQLVQGAPIVDMYFPLTMQFNDNAQYDNASLGALGAGVEDAVQRGVGALEAAISEAGKSFTSIIDVATGNDQLGETAFKLGAARAIDKVSLLSTGVANALTLQNRAIINPNIRSLFRGVGLREFTFQFKMIARSQREAEEVRRIVKHFRQEMYPDAYTVGNADIGFKFPNMFEITFNYNGFPNKNIPKIHLCYLRNVSTTINPTGGAMRRDGSPNEIDLTLSFVEYKTLKKDDVRLGGY